MLGDTTVKAQEKGVNMDSDTCVIDDRRSSEAAEIEMEGHNVVLNRNGYEPSIEIHASLNGVNARGESHKHGDGIKSVAEIGKDPSETSENDTNEVGNDGKEVDEDDIKDEFYVGKFVWGKVKNNPWWPGQIYDPSDASDFAKKLQKSEKLLVAYFGDGSFSWCSKSQLKHFAENFEKITKQNTSKKLAHAVEEAVTEVGRIAESKLSIRGGLARPLAVNAGIRQGVLVPEYDLSEISQLEPVNIISMVRNFAMNASFSHMLELTVLKSWLSAFYCANGKNELSTLHDPHAIGGLVDVSNPVLDRDGGLFDEDRTSVPRQHQFGELNQPCLRRCEGIEADKLYRKRKRISVSKLMKEDKGVDPKNETKYENMKCLEEILSAERVGSEDKEAKEKDQVSPIEKDDRDKLVSTYGKKMKNELAFVRGCENKVLGVDNGGGEGQLSSDKKTKESITEKVDKIAIGETENVAASIQKRETRSSVKDSKRVSVYQAREDLAPSFQKTTRKRNQNEALDEITEKNKSAENGSKSKVSRIENDELEVTENGPENYKEPGHEKMNKTTKGETENVAASGEKSSVRGSRETTGDEAPNHKGKDPSSQLQMTTRKRKKNEKLDFPEIKDEKECAKMERNDKVTGVENNNLEETENVRASRERKKSMYLSAPFVNFTPKTARIGERINKVAGQVIGFTPKTARIGERMNKVAGQVIGSTPTFNRNNKPFQKNLPKEVDTFIYASLNPPSEDEVKVSIHKGVTGVADQITKSSSSLNSIDEPWPEFFPNKVVTSVRASSKGEEKKIIDSVRIDVLMEKVVSEIRSAALNPLALWDKNFLNKIEGFTFAYRNVNYLCGSSYKKYHSAQQGKKCKYVKTGSKLVKPNDEGTGEEASKPVSLMVIFPPEFCLPTKTELIAICSQFGRVNKMETDVSHECYCAKVVFLSDSDTEKAFNTCLENSPFGSAKVSYRLRYYAGSSKAKEIVKKPNMLWDSAEFEGSCLLFLKQKLERITSMVDNCGGNMSREWLGKLEKEMKGLLDSVSSLTKSSSAKKA